MNLSEIIAAAQTERGLVMHYVAFHPREELGSKLQLIKTFKSFEGGDLVLVEHEGFFRVGRISIAATDAKLAEIADCDWWGVANLDEYLSVADGWKKEQRTAEKQISRSIATREAREAMKAVGLELTDIFAIENKGTDQ